MLRWQRAPDQSHRCCFLTTMTSSLRVDGRLLPAQARRARVRPRRVILGLRRSRHRAPNMGQAAQWGGRRAEPPTVKAVVRRPRSESASRRKQGAR